jgi:hypothetical protein
MGLSLLWGINSVLLCYRNQKGTRTGEFMELSAIGKVARVVANYSAWDNLGGCVWQVFLAHLWQLTLAHLWKSVGQLSGMEMRWASG